MGRFYFKTQSSDLNMHVSIETCGCKIGHSSPIREPPAGAISPLVITACCKYNEQVQQKTVQKLNMNNE